MLTLAEILGNIMSIKALKKLFKNILKYDMNTTKCYIQTIKFKTKSYNNNFLKYLKKCIKIIL